MAPWADKLHTVVLCYSLSPTLCDLMDCSLPGFSVHGILQARILEWVAISSSRLSSWPRDETHVSCIGRWILYRWAPREAQFFFIAFIISIWPPVSFIIYFFLICLSPWKCKLHVSRDLGRFVYAVFSEPKTCVVHEVSIKYLSSECWELGLSGTHLLVTGADGREVPDF